ncbi:SDR family oxidoreductase [Hoeflea ulvae]|uniref:SDR family NAD(P)-dependent oxidoreductase n=1 Tax=Hoeflea ulvae TaxID=2983764 RepID=A0ABT3YD75_9HYPH|nr:SDR family NAD(P)-dependent oxidoreductase [Hoeflea ulvae]MCY0093813.1 SDR family NAD(P)-dependent oxidoreductase [Hoeflea ulvae]
MSPRIAMISGAGRGLGAAIAERLLADGWSLSLGMRDTGATQDEYDAKAPGRVLCCRFDATDKATAQSWVDQTIEHFGRIDALVNNAGILRMVDFDQGSEDDLDDLWSVNVKAPFRLIRAALPHLRTTGQGRVVNIASTDAKRFRGGTSVGYSMTKHALLAMTQAVRFAGWDEGLRATAMCPGAIDTDLIANAPSATPKADRLTPETVAGMVAFVLALPNQASVPEFISNTRLESLI